MRVRGAEASNELPREGRPTNSKGERKGEGGRERKVLSEEVGTGDGVRGRGIL